MTKTSPSLKKLVDLHLTGRSIDPESRCETVASLLYLTCLLICYFDKSLMLSYSSNDTQSSSATTRVSLREGIDALKERSGTLMDKGKGSADRDQTILLDALKRFDQKYLLTFG